MLTQKQHPILFNLQPKIMNQEKIKFIQQQFILLVQTLSINTKPKWGLMNAQQMVEHVTAFFNISTEKIKFPLVTPEEHLPKLKAFLHSDKPFQENTKAPESVIPATPLPLQYADMPTAINKLQQAIDDFFIFFKDDKSKTTLQPVFGYLNFEDWILLHYKHCMHHARQFNLID